MVYFDPEICVFDAVCYLGVGFRTDSIGGIGDFLEKELRGHTLNFVGILFQRYAGRTRNSFFQSGYIFQI